ncbi:Inactive ubiquitin carboxyl-terminal hydrolase 53 [Camellia lanceoleosa]|uniref:Inactive ubiquitin carboxyl-terminal hydrolase 53 n=1 Tax=Camellia lanceoleosa TaxID=1840588 RepID=A0ACC0J278_9ERIC|nr:Inactive ubiquitin carboxyl-terminal hydrolase 53 [Camellia lanceoleosa]
MRLNPHMKNQRKGRFTVVVKVEAKMTFLNLAQVNLVCRYQQHYICFVYNHEHEKWILYDDEILQVMGGWDEVLTMCETGQLQPEILFFEAAE